ncbi:MAG: hypothetical protein KA801_15715 [Syntrophorhabdaceae bacterium]|nr:hypothetical protein [Syntrophorhabdaceae bacterium]
MSDIIQGGYFDNGLSGWHVVSGQVFVNYTPVPADSILANDVEINGRPVVPLGGDYWHGPYPIAERGTHLLRVSSASLEVLDSDVFVIRLPYLAFCLGGSATRLVALELRVPAASAKISGFPALDQPDADGFVAVRIQNPSGSDVLREYTWNLAGARRNVGLLRTKAKVRLRINGSLRGKRPLRLAAGKIRLQSDPPPPYHLPLWGWADIHCHPMAQAGFGGFLAGHMHGPVEDLGSCLQKHGWKHSNPTHPMGLALNTGNRNDGSLSVPGWTMGTPQPGDEFGFQGWPKFDDLIHIKTHQDWIRRAYDGGLRLMVALVVHNELLAGIAQFPVSPQSDRDTIEPQVQMLKEFVVHNKDWCGLARTPAEARALLEQNRMAFVLGLETDSVNGWINRNEFRDDPSQANRDAIRGAIYPYFEYLRNLGIVQINLVHLSDNAFGGMALYEMMSLFNTLQRTGEFPAGEDGYYEQPVPGQPKTPRPEDEQISKPISIPSELRGLLDKVAQLVGIPLPQALTNPDFPGGNRNVRGMTIAGEVALRVAMQLGMVIDIDHMSERCTHRAYEIATKSLDDHKYPLIVAHNGARNISPRPLSNSSDWSDGSELRRNPEVWPSEGAKSDKQIDYIKETGGIFGNGTSVIDSRGYGPSHVKNDCPGTVKSFAQGYQYVTDKLNMPVALGTDLNVLLAGLGPRFGPRAACGLIGEIGMGDDAWKKIVRQERLLDAEAQHRGVTYDSPIRDWRTYRFQFPEEGDLYSEDACGDLQSAAGIYLQRAAGECHLMWQAMALFEVLSNDRNMSLEIARDQDPQLDQRVIDMVTGMQGTTSNVTPPPHYRAGLLMNNESAKLEVEDAYVQLLVHTLRKIRDLWNAMSNRDNNVPMKRSTAGPIRDFDFNLEGLAHYGMLPDMFQDLKNTGLPRDTFSKLLGSAERYIQVWEKCAELGATIKD